MGPGSDGPIGAMGGMEPHHMNGSLGNKKIIEHNTLHAILFILLYFSNALQKCPVVYTTIHVGV